MNNGEYRTFIQNKINVYHSIGMSLYFISFLSICYLFIQKNPFTHKTSSFLKIGDYRDLKQIGNLINSKDFERSILIDPFLLEINKKEYKGTWKKNNDNTYNLTALNYSEFNLTNDFKYTEGEMIINFNIEDLSISSTSGKKIIVSFSLKDGRYKEHWISIKTEFFHYPLNNIDDVSFSFNYSNGNAKAQVRNKNKVNGVLTKYSLLHQEQSIGK
jgi:hypothetical protein